MSLHKEIILGEIAGKNSAIHAYDKILWMIRSGYLTLFYGGCSPTGTAMGISTSSQPRKMGVGVIWFENPSNNSVVDR